MRYALILVAVGVLGIAVALGTRSVLSSTGNLTPDMILTALQSAHVATAPGSRMELIDRREGAAGWHEYRLDRLSIRANGGHFTIEGDATRLR